MKWSCDTALVITDQKGAIFAESHKNKQWESSSTIKIPIIYLALQKMTANRVPLSGTLTRQLYHDSIGSGIINWTDWRDISFYHLIQFTLVYSDCVATNMLIDYVGGRQALNKWLTDEGFSTRLTMDYIDFAEEETSLPSVGTTTAKEMMDLYKLLEDEKWPTDYRRLLNNSMSHVHQSWFAESLGETTNLAALKHKTGSMIDCGPYGETVYNAAGSFRRGSKKYYFCLLSRGYQNKTPPITPEHIKHY